MNQRANVILDGAIDLHCHFGPEPLVEKITRVPHSVDPLQAAMEAHELGMRALVLKSHEFSSTAAAYAAHLAVPAVGVFGGVCCDHPVGGLNPHAVEATLANDGKIVWLPTLSARTDAPVRTQQAFGVDDGIAVADDDGEVLPDVVKIMDLVRAHDAVLATGHTTRDEHFAVARRFGHQGRLVITHAMQQTTGPRLTPDDCVELAERGAWIELTAHSCLGSPSTFADVVDVVRRVGPERILLSTDYGFSTKVPNPAAGFLSYVDRLWNHGVTEADLRTMVCTNPARLLGLE